MHAVGYTMDIVYFSWLDDPIEIVEDLQLPQFELKEITKEDCSQNYTAGEKTYSRHQNSFRTAFTDLNLYCIKGALALFVLVFFLVTCAR